MAIERTRPEEVSMGSEPERIPVGNNGNGTVESNPNLLSRHRILILQSSIAGEDSYRPLVLNESSQEPEALFLLTELDRLSEKVGSYGRYEKTRQKLKRPIHGGRRRSSRQVAEALKKLKPDKINIAEARNRLGILTNKEFRPIKLVIKEEKIVGWEPGVFPSHKEGVWWKLIAKDVPGLFEVVEGDPESARHLRQGFNLRYQMRWGLGDEVQRANEEYSGEFGEIIRKLPEQQGAIIGPLLRKITEAIP